MASLHLNFQNKNNDISVIENPELFHLINNPLEGFFEETNNNPLIKVKKYFCMFLCQFNFRFDSTEETRYNTNNVQTQNL